MHNELYGKYKTLLYLKNGVIILAEARNFLEYASWYHVLETLSELPTICEGNTPAIHGFPSQRPNNAKVWYFPSCGPEQAFQIIRKTYVQQFDCIHQSPQSFL